MKVILLFVIGNPLGVKAGEELVADPQGCYLINMIPISAVILFVGISNT